MPLDVPPNEWNSHLEWDLWNARVRRFRAGVSLFFILGVIPIGMMSAWPLLLFVPFTVGMRRWRLADERRLAAKHAPEPIIPSELERWDAALRIETGKDAAKLSRAMVDLERELAIQATAEEARREALRRDLIRRGF